MHNVYINIYFMLIKASCLFIYKPTEDCFNMKHCVLDLSNRNNMFN